LAPSSIQRTSIDPDGDVEALFMSGEGEGSMSAGDAKGSFSKRVEEIWEERRNVFLGALNDRIRTIALASLVLIWGLFIGEAHKDVSMGRYTRLSLLLVALGSVTVLLTEYFEQWTRLSLHRIE
jgi:hypothetical protein